MTVLNSSRDSESAQLILIALITAALIALGIIIPVAHSNEAEGPRAKAPPGCESQRDAWAMP